MCETHGNIRPDTGGLAGGQGDDRDIRHINDDLIAKAHHPAGSGMGRTLVRPIGGRHQTRCTSKAQRDNKYETQYSVGFIHQVFHESFIAQLPYPLLVALVGLARVDLLARGGLQAFLGDIVAAPAEHLDEMQAE